MSRFPVLPSLPPSPHLRYYGGSFGRISLMANNVVLADHARDCEQLLVNVDTRPLGVRVDGGNQRLLPGEAILIRPRQTYALPAGGYRAANAGPGVLLLKASERLCRAAGLADVARYPDAHRQRVMLERRQREPLQAVLRELQTSTPGSAGLNEAVSTLFCHAVARALGSAPTRSATLPQTSLAARISRDADGLVFGDMNVFRNMQDIADSYHVSERHLFTLFRRATGLTPHVFYNMRRLEMSFALLLDIRRGIGEIAYELGFAAPPHFTRFMRANTGWTPSAYRQAIAAVPEELRPGVADTRPFEQIASPGMRRLQ